MKISTRPPLLATLAAAILFSTSACRAIEPAAPAKAEQFNGATPLQWSLRLADSETARRGDRLAWKPGGNAKWDYTAGLFTLSLLKLNEKVPTPAYVEFSQNAIGSFITPDGGIQGYKPDEYNIDNIAPGKTAIALYELTKEERYKKCAALLRKQLDTQPRTSQGGFWHKLRYPSQMWLDGLFMGAPFYAEYAVDFHGPTTDLDDVVKQFRLIDEHLYDAKSGLFFHGWDEKREQDWANKTTGTSSNFWGRGLGWFAMAQADVLDFLPPGHPGRGEIIALLKKTSDGIVKHQDAASGLWWQVLDQGGREGNYLEATASAMFVYAMAKAVNNGNLPRDYVSAILKGYDGIITKLIKTDAAGQVSLTKCCSVAGLGYGRDGSYAYYLREPVIDNDLKGVGPFILAGIEVQKLLGLPMTATHEIKPGPVAVPDQDSLFNGHDLTGWTNLNGAKFSATNGVIHLDASSGWLCTTRVFTNFIFEAECRALETNYNSGFFIRAGLDGTPFPTNAWQINLKQSALGALLRGRDTVVSNALPAKPVGEWFTFRITVNGISASLDADGKPLWRFDQLDAASGCIGLQAEGKAFEFRNLRVTETGMNHETR